MIGDIAIEMREQAEKNAATDSACLAFPGTQYAAGISPSGHSEGMTLRDYFAAKVCAAMVSTISSDDDYHRAIQIAAASGFDGLSEWFAHDAYKQADAMLAARNK